MTNNLNNLDDDKENSALTNGNGNENAKFFVGQNRSKANLNTKRKFALLTSTEKTFRLKKIKSYEQLENSICSDSSNLDTSSSENSIISENKQLNDIQDPLSTKDQELQKSIAACLAYSYQPKYFANLRNSQVQTTLYALPNLQNVSPSEICKACPPKTVNIGHTLLNQYNDILVNHNNYRTLTGNSNGSNISMINHVPEIDFQSAEEKEIKNKFDGLDGQLKQLRLNYEQYHQSLNSLVNENLDLLNPESSNYMFKNFSNLSNPYNITSNKCISNAVLPLAANFMSPLFLPEPYAPYQTFNSIPLKPTPNYTSNSKANCNVCGNDNFKENFSTLASVHYQFNLICNKANKFINEKNSLERELNLAITIITHVNTKLSFSNGDQEETMKKHHFFRSEFDRISCKFNYLKYNFNNYAKKADTLIVEWNTLKNWIKSKKENTEYSKFPRI